MSFKVEIGSADAKLLAALLEAKATSCTSWDSTIKEGTTMKVTIDYPLSEKLPTAAVDAINRCIVEVLMAYGLSHQATGEP